MTEQLSITTIRERVKHIKKIASDDEAAHGREDDLWLDVLKHIAEHGDAASASFASEALKTTEIDFSRWCA